ncbi:MULTISPECIES: exonuclease domain-containing protein [unclassified Neptuniibacter]|uniref:3'-5' exonuclease n=1 Tax=unclassified Neptuniibacter TaxID=2630693 RepID=UPI0026E1BD29|nr:MULTISPECIES: exonuclease domain-containing protein [unclassified Neptuniibacter]MDO6513516.1 exonuclease domain-containing protein [Neptuniibacter sp. 2_MG-2023]MDO6593662.1 exonuclease domain-containing protein [Neptuniibacter sp. 1_MG-2023]
MELICIDLEASGLGAESYPIEIAWINDKTGEQDSFLINPESAAGWHYWDEHAEEVHGIDRDDLVSKGLDIVNACKRMNKMLTGKTLISDAFEFDLFWLSRLFEATGIQPSFRMAGLDRILNKEQRIQFSFLAKAQLRRHRALQDVEDIIKCIKAVTLQGPETA